MRWERLIDDFYDDRGVNPLPIGEALFQHVAMPDER